MHNKLIDVIVYRFFCKNRDYNKAFINKNEYITRLKIINNETSLYFIFKFVLAKKETISMF